MPGCNKNQVLCITENASKVFDFGVCVLETPSCLDANGASVACEPPVTNEFVLDCGCVPNQYHTDVCDCPQGLSQLHPPEGCTISRTNGPDNCKVVCNEPDP
jgi:hypothetical protein